MRQNILFLITISLFSVTSFAEVSFQATYGYIAKEQIADVLITSNNEYIITGYTDSYGDIDKDVFAIKLDSTGNLKWFKTYGKTGNDEGVSVVNWQSDYLIVASSANISTSGRSVYLIEIDENGDTIQTKTYSIGNSGGGLNPVKAVKAHDQGLAIAGTSSYISIRGNSFLLKLDQNLNYEWLEMYSIPTGGMSFNHLQQTADNGYIITSILDDIGGAEASSHLLKLDSLGNEQREVTFSINSFEGSTEISSVTQADDGGYFFAGIASEASPALSGTMLVKTNALLVPEWGVIYDSLNIRNARPHTVTNSIYIAGNAKYGANVERLVLTEINISGQMESIRLYGDTVNQNLLATFMLSGNQEALLFGYTQGFTSGAQNDLYMVKTDSSFGTKCYYEKSNTVDTISYIPAILAEPFEDSSINIGTWINDSTTVTNVVNYNENIYCQCLGELPNSAFSYYVSGDEVTFELDSPHFAYEFYWDFGDGSFSSQENPTHTFADTGNYEVCLYTSNGCGDSMNCLNINISGDGTTKLEVINLEKIIISNPFKEELVITNNQSTRSLTIYDFQGKTYYKNTFEHGKKTFTIDTKDFPSGIYFIECRPEETIYIQKAVKY